MSLEKSFASHEKAKFWSDKNDVKAEDVALNSNRKFYFNCLDCKHTFYSSLNNISQNRWCSFCALKKLCDDGNCTKCLERSFASHEKANLWSEKNGNITPRQIFKCSGKAFWFQCKDCTHHFRTPISHIVRTENDKFCPICSSQYICYDLDCKICFAKSFASYEKSKQFSLELNNGVNPRNIFLNSNDKYWFNCDCGHSFQGVPNAITQGRWCPYCCVPTIKLCDDNQCLQCYNKSFASHPKSTYLVDKTLNARQMFKNTHAKHYFKCEKGHKFNKQISLINLHFGWCPKCINKTEQKLNDKLLNLYEGLVFQYRVDWCRNNETNQYLPFDFALEDNKIIIELDGKQHFKQVNNWGTPEDIRKRDKYKMQKANENGFSVIRIIQLDVLTDKYNWLDELKANIDLITMENKIQNILMCKDNEYDIYKD